MLTTKIRKNKFEIIVISIAFIISIIWSLYNIKNFDNNKINFKGDWYNQLIYADIGANFSKADDFRKKLRNGQSFFEALPIYEKYFLPNIIVGYYYYIVDKEIYENKPNDQRVIKVDNKKFGLLFIQIIFFYISVIFFASQLKKKIDRLKLTYEIILIDDGSQDRTYITLLEIKKKYNFINLIKNRINTGKSYSILKGIKKSKYKNIVMIDCDLPYFKSVDKIVYFLKKDKDLVIINRKLKESKLANKKLNLYQVVRFCLGAIIAFINKKILKLDIEGGDTQAGLKGFKKNKYFKKNKFISTKFFFDLELIHLYSKKKLKIVSVKTIFNVPKKSSIKIFNLIKNYYILKELIKILLFYSKAN